MATNESAPTSPLDADALLKLAGEAKARADATPTDWALDGERSGAWQGKWSVVGGTGDDWRVLLSFNGNFDPDALGAFVVASRSDVPTLADGVIALAADNARLHRLLTRAAEPFFGAFEQDADGMVSSTVSDHAGIGRYLFGTMAGMLEGMGGGRKAPNYIQIGGWHPETGRIECIIQRVGKLTPHEARGQAEAHLARAVAMLAEHGIPWDGPTTFLPSPLPGDEIGPTASDEESWIRIDVRVQPNELLCTRCNGRQAMPSQGTAAVLNAMMAAFRDGHADCQEGDATAVERVVPRG